MHTPLLDIAPTDLVDIAVVGLLLWGLVVWTRRARMALLGLAFLGVFYHLIAQQFKLQLTTWILQGFFAALVVVVVVVFQNDLRRLFEQFGQIATLGLRRKAPRPDPSSVGTLTRGLCDLAAKRRGALVVLPGHGPIERHFLQHGIPLDAEISEELLDSLFDPGSAGHDGALVMENNRIKEFGVHLPLSENRDELKGGGTRHAAALGLAERSDALCLVVSEERGTIGIAARGQLEILSASTQPGDLTDKIQDHLEHTGTEVKERRIEWRWLGRRLMEGLLSLALALGAWLVFVPVEEAVLQVRVDVENVPEGYVLTDVSPQEVEVEVAGPRRAMLLASNADFQIVIDADLVRLQRRTFEVSAQSVRHATGLEIKSIKPEKVKLSVQKTRGGAR